MLFIVRADDARQPGFNYFFIKPGALYGLQKKRDVLQTLIESKCLRGAAIKMML